MCVREDGKRYVCVCERDEKRFVCLCERDEKECVCGKDEKRDVWVCVGVCVCVRDWLGTKGCKAFCKAPRGSN